MSAGTFGSVRTTEPPVLTKVEVVPRPGAWNMMESSTSSLAVSGSAASNSTPETLMLTVRPGRQSTSVTGRYCKGQWTGNRCFRWGDCIRVGYRQGALKPTAYRSLMTAVLFTPFQATIERGGREMWAFWSILRQKTGI